MIQFLSTTSLCETHWSFETVTKCIIGQLNNVIKVLHCWCCGPVCAWVPLLSLFHNKAAMQMNWVRSAVYDQHCIIYFTKGHFTKVWKWTQKSCLLFLSGLDLLVFQVCNVESVHVHFRQTFLLPPTRSFAPFGISLMASCAVLQNFTSQLAVVENLHLDPCKNWQTRPKLKSIIS